jgi:uncharacterized coiled-coil protein SlyX
MHEHQLSNEQKIERLADRIAKLQMDIAKQRELIALQQEALRTLSTVCAGHQKIIEALQPESQKPTPAMPRAAETVH